MELDRTAVQEAMEADYRPDCSLRTSVPAQLRQQIDRSGANAHTASLAYARLDLPDQLKEELNRLACLLHGTQYEVSLKDKEGTLLYSSGTRDSLERLPEEASTKRGPDPRLSAPIFIDAECAFGTLEIADTRYAGNDNPLLARIIETTARAIAERLFRLQHRNDWVIALVRGSPDRFDALLAVDQHQCLTGTDRNALLAFPAGRLEKGVTLWKTFVRNCSLFRSRGETDAVGRFAALERGELWKAVVTPPEAISFPWLKADVRAQTRPRLETIGSIHDHLAAPAGRYGGLRPSKLQHVRGFIEQHLHERVDLETLARTAGLSRHHFSRAFKQSVGMAPSNYVVHQRILRAQWLLCETDMPLTEIAQSCGFSDQSHFSRRFRKEIGVPPGMYKWSVR